MHSLDQCSGGLDSVSPGGSRNISKPGLTVVLLKSRECTRLEEVHVRKTTIILILFMYITAALAAQTETGEASWYGGKFQGRRTANGEIFDTHQLTGAHKTLPFDTRVKVTNLKNGKTVEVRINDRGPFIKGRIIDLSMAAAQQIDLLGSGVTRVKIEVMGSSSGPEESSESPGRKSSEHESPGSESAEVQSDSRDLLVYTEPQYYSIQVASFGEEENARQLRTKLASSGFAPVFESSQNGHIRVILPKLTEQEIEETVLRLSELGHTAILVRKHYGRD